MKVKVKGQGHQVEKRDFFTRKNSYLQNHLTYGHVIQWDDEPK